MRRGYYAIREAIDAKFIGPDKPLLIIGAGVAGLMAAMTAVEGDVPAYLVEQERILATQATCGSRFVCPTQYDWPADHWNVGSYPFEDVPMPFSWTRGVVAHVVDLILRQKVDNFLRNRLLNVFISRFTDYRTFPRPDGRHWIVPILDPPPQDKDFPFFFSMVLSCAGFGDENTTAKRVKICPKADDRAPSSLATDEPTAYMGNKFWHADYYESESPLLGLQSGRTPNVLISGGGDGALQDFLRIVTREPPTRPRAIGEFYSAVATNLKRATRTKLESDFLALETSHKQQNASANNRQDRCSINAHTYAATQRLIEELREDHDAWPKITKTLDRLVRDLQNDLKIKLAYPCSHTSPYYPLNRFLVLLIVRYAEDKYPGDKLLYPNTMISNTAGVGHECGVPTRCHDKDHEVLCTAANCLDFDRECITHESRFPDGPYNVLIIRHGVPSKTRPNLLANH
jgi:hypothetical protein